MPIAPGIGRYVGVHNVVARTSEMGCPSSSCFFLLFFLGRISRGGVVFPVAAGIHCWHFCGESDREVNSVLQVTLFLSINLGDAVVFVAADGPVPTLALLAAVPVAVTAGAAARSR